ncbi:hypothetical protein, partial [Candidatus Protofrankia datiscae]|uniref:hypothetical protein n=2 Tax=Protofrankia TaxID=2994361 RepID=UPI0019CF759D
PHPTSPRATRHAPRRTTSCRLKPLVPRARSVPSALVGDSIRDEVIKDKAIKDKATDGRERKRTPG